MNCNKVSNLLSAFMDGELLGHEHRLIHHHLQSCADCRSEYEELLHMKRLLAAMRLREPGQRLAVSIVERVSLEGANPAAVDLGPWRVQVPALRANPLFFSPMIGLGVGLTFFGILLWSHPTRPPVEADGSHRSLVFELANPTRDEPPPRVQELTNGLMREAAPRPAAYEPRYPMEVPDFPLASRMRHPIPVRFVTAGMYR